jgi:hypothetical protein
MDKARAISLVVGWIRSRGLDYPTEGLDADRFEAGWSVYAPVEVDESDPMAFLEMPVGQSVFLVGDSGRIEEVSSSVPPQHAIDRFMAQERGGAPEAQFMAEMERSFNELASQHPPAVSSFAVVDHPPEEAIAEEASRLIDPIVQQLAQLGPYGWQWLSAEFAFTVSSEIARLRFWSGTQSAYVPVPEPVAALVRQQRHIAAGMPAGPWWRLQLTVTNAGVTTTGYDYGDHPFPHDQLLAPEHYRNDMARYPRPEVPAWLAMYAGAR